MSFEEDLKLIAAAKKSIDDESKNISHNKIRDINLINNDISVMNHEEILMKLIIIYWNATIENLMKTLIWLWEN